MKKLSTRAPKRIKVTKAVTFSPEMVKFIDDYAKKERRSFSNAVEFLIMSSHGHLLSNIVKHK